MPSIQVNDPQADRTSVAVVKVLMVKSSVMIESQPAAEPPTIVNVGVLVDAVYVIPSIHVKVPQADCTSVAVVKVLIVKSSVMTESQPATDPFGIVKVAVLLDEV